VNLVRPDAVDQFKAALVSDYRKFRGLTPEMHVCAASPGASEIIF